jgi:hypothetical protein
MANYATTDRAVEMVFVAALIFPAEGTFAWKDARSQHVMSVASPSGSEACGMEKRHYIIAEQIDCNEPASCRT